ncbi:MAG: PAS domain-containing protein [Fibrobacteria bacterium]|nr:PAS domain-containing protein [Fibrobacteria bacterium]
MISLKKCSVKRKLIFIQLITAGIVVLFTFISFGIYDFRFFSSYVMDELTSTAKLISTNTASSLAFKDNGAAVEALATLDLEEDIVNAWIYDNEGNLFATYNKKGYADYSYPLADTNCKRVKECFVKHTRGMKDACVTISKEIKIEDEVLGMLSLRLSLTQYKHMAIQSIIVTISILFVGFAMAFILSLYLQGTISRPILKLAAAGKQVIATGDYSVQVAKEGNDEIGELYDDFNKVMQQVHLREQERDNAEKSLRESEERFKTLVANIPGATYRCANDKSWTMEFISDEIKHISGYVPDDLINNKQKSFADIIVEEDLAQVNALVQNSIQNHEPYSVEYRLKHANGSIIWVHDRGQAVFKDNNVICLDGAIFDVTSNKQAETLAKQQREKLIQTDKMSTLGILVSGVAHEINNPNNFMLLNSNNLSDIWKDLKPMLDTYSEEKGDFIVAGLPYSEIRDDMEMLIGGIVEGTGRIKKIVESLKDFARKDQGSMNQQVNVNTIIEASLIIMSNLIKKSTDHLKVIYGHEIPLIIGNSQQIEQVIINLISNACQSLEQKNQSVKISTSYDKIEKKVIISVEDEGNGISQDNIKHIMDPFFTTKRDSGGTGLGLSISYTIIKEHGGELIINSEPGEGTVARIELPIQV